MDGSGNRLAGQGGFEQTWTTCRDCGCPAGGVVDLKVIGMPIASPWVVAHKDVDPLIVQDRGDALSNLVRVHVRQAGGMLPMQAGIRIAELLKAMHAEDVRRLRELGLAHQSQVWQVLCRCQPCFAVGRHDQDDP